jgi:hypothetical protein
MNSVPQSRFHFPPFLAVIDDMSPATRRIRELQRRFGALPVAAKVCSTGFFAQTLQRGETD